MTKRVLCLLFPGFEEIETITPIDLLRRAGAKVILASVTGESSVTGRSELTLLADLSLEEVIRDPFDLLLIPGGPGVKTLRSDGRPARLARDYHKAGRLVGAICAAPTVLADAGVLEGKRFTAHCSVHAELPGALGEERVVEDGALITSRGAGTAVEFGLVLVKHLFGEAKAREVSDSIMF